MASRTGAAITGLMKDYPRGHVIAPHAHRRDQLVYATRGVMTVTTGEGSWVVPTHRAVWIPAGVAHSIAMSGSVQMRTLYMRTRMAKALPSACCVVVISALLRELIVAACRVGGLERRIPWQRHLADTILDQLRSLEQLPLRLPNPRDPRATRIVQALVADPGDDRPLERLCRISGASKRTIERLFVRQVGMSVGRWRQQLRLMHAMRLLATGSKVTHAALEAGYATPSAFIWMFRRQLGTTPGSWLRGNNPDRGDPTRAAARRPTIRRAGTRPSR
jgi:AraC-like DNA-binding protein